MLLDPSNQAAVLKHIGKSDLNKIRECLTSAPEAYIEEYSGRENHSPRSRASLISDRLLEKARETFTGRGYNVVPEGGRPLVTLRDKVTVWFRKLDARGRPSSKNSTHFANNYKNQEDLENTEISSFSVHLIAGYQLDFLGATVTGVYLLCPQGERILWETPLMEDGRGLQSEIEFTPRVPLIGPKITIKRRARLEADGSNGE
jgi:hypothetical protein